MSDELLQRAWRTQCWLSAIGDYENRSDLKVSAETVSDLIAEIERLRAALQEIRNSTGCCDCPANHHYSDCTEWIGQIAAEALNPSPQE